MPGPVHTAHRQIWRDGSLSEGTRLIPEETALALTYNGGTYAVMMGSPQNLRDFAIGFGQPENLSEQAAAYLLASGQRVYACHRGLNVPGKTPRFLLRHAFSPEHPMAFTRLCLEGGGDRRLAGRVREMVRRVGVLPAAEGAPAAVFQALTAPASGWPRRA